MSAAACTARGCGNSTTDPSALCYAHRHLRVVTTPGGQTAFRGGGVLDIAPRLSKESFSPPPRDSARIAGFPYATVSDVAAWKNWRSGQGTRPDTAGVLERMPIELPLVLGSQIAGDELGIYDARGDLYLLGEPDGRHQVIEQVARDQGWVRTYRTASGVVFAVRSAEEYQVVRVDESRLPA